MQSGKLILIERFPLKFIGRLGSSFEARVRMKSASFGSEPTLYEATPIVQCSRAIVVGEGGKNLQGRGKCSIYPPRELERSSISLSPIFIDRHISAIFPLTVIN